MAMLLHFYIRQLQRVGKHKTDAHLFNKTKPITVAIQINNEWEPSAGGW